MGTTVQNTSSAQIAGLPLTAATSGTVRRTQPTRAHLDSTSRSELSRPHIETPFGRGAARLLGQIDQHQTQPTRTLAQRVAFIEAQQELEKAKVEKQRHIDFVVRMAAQYLAMQRAQKEFQPDLVKAVDVIPAPIVEIKEEPKAEPTVKANTQNAAAHLKTKKPIKVKSVAATTIQDEAPTEAKVEKAIATPVAVAEKPVKIAKTKNIEPKQVKAIEDQTTELAPVTEPAEVVTLQASQVMTQLMIFPQTHEGVATIQVRDASSDIVAQTNFALTPLRRALSTVVTIVRSEDLAFPREERIQLAQALSTLGFDDQTTDQVVINSTSKEQAVRNLANLFTTITLQDVTIDKAFAIIEDILFKYEMSQPKPRLARTLFVDGRGRDTRQEFSPFDTTVAPSSTIRIEASGTGNNANPDSGNEEQPYQN